MLGSWRGSAVPTLRCKPMHTCTTVMHTTLAPSNTMAQTNTTTQHQAGNTTTATMTPLLLSEALPYNPAADSAVHALMWCCDAAFLFRGAFVIGPTAPVHTGILKQSRLFGCAGPFS